ncbi:Gfo/Idh/MocA family oxidoreductase [Anaerococcus hydrogenalis]|uniref:Gfo/Idh/MocA family protein n=1 Tax=Anaerococcus hydrogenalis TaxID=33029 RepID=UPI00290105E2|nr:Gfo/Idh/MocA family oxidoreductase [Anaerococcus hydrogenalis]MDU1316761.1 Gfo/Idh/MocA family oxidoreductase [Anaerococcus hydrogenalis]
MIKFASIGSNFIVHNILSTITKMESYKYYGAYSRSIEKANKLKEKFGAEKSFDSLERMLSDPEINFVYIASPNSLHYKQAKMCLEAGKNVICEKPFFTNTKELDDLIKISDDKKLFLFEAISIKYLPSLNILKSLLRKIGKISTCMINYSQYSSRFDKYKAGIVENIFKSEFSAGALADLGIYNLHLIYELFGIGEEFSYFGNINSYGVDISGSGLISYGDFSVSFTNAKDSKSENYIIVQGEEGYIKVYGNIQEAEKIEIFKDGESEFIDIKKERDLYFYEFEYFREIFENKDFESSKKKLIDSRNVLEMFEKLKISGNIRDSYNYIEPSM